MARQYRRQDIDVQGVNLCTYESGEIGAQQVLLVHATGFHARCWDKVVELLPPDWHVICVDLRGHGLSDNSPPFTWDRFAQDLLSVADQFELSDAIGVGHSLGGHCIAHICALRAELFQSLVLLDPVIFPPELYRDIPKSEITRVEDHPIARRRSEFASWQDFHARYEQRHPYSLWRTDVFRDYCEYGVVPNDQGDGVTLACPGKVEAAIYMTNYDTDLYPLLDRIQQPTTVMRATPRDPDSATMDFSSSPTWPGLADALSHGRDVYLPELTHFIPMQAPELVAQEICNSVVR